MSCSRLVENKCLICREDLEYACDVKKMYSKGRDMVLKCAMKIGRSDIVDCLSRDPSTVRVHTSCYVKFTLTSVQLPVGVEEEELQAGAPPVKKLRSQVDKFEWSTHCFFCFN